MNPKLKILILEIFNKEVQFIQKITATPDIKDAHTKKFQNTIQIQFTLLRDRHIPQYYT